MQDYQNKSLIKRVKRNVNFTHLSNEVFNAGLSPDSLGVLCYILHLPDDWIIHKTHLQKVFKIGRERMDRIFNEIEKSGFLISTDMIRSGGKFIGRNYFFYDEPQNKPMLSEPLSAKPTAANTQLLNTNIELNTNNTNTPISPKGEESSFEEIGLSIKDWIDAYVRIHKKFGVQRSESDINKSYLTRKLTKWRELELDNQKPLHALYGILSDKWEREHRYPSAKLSNLFNLDTIARWCNRIESKC